MDQSLQKKIKYFFSKKKGLGILLGIKFKILREGDIKKKN